MKIHMGDEYKCEECDYKMIWKCDIKTHGKIHVGNEYSLMATPQHPKCGPIRKSLLTPCRRVGLSRIVKPSSFNSPDLKRNVTPVPVKAVVNTVEAARAATNTINHENTEIKKSDTELHIKKGTKRKEATVNAFLNDSSNIEEIKDCTSNKPDVYSVKISKNIDNVETLEIQSNIENVENLNKDDVSVKRRRKPKKLDDMYIYTKDQNKKSPCKDVTLLTNKNNTRNKTSVSSTPGGESKTAVINITSIDLKDQNATTQKKTVIKSPKKKMKVEHKYENEILKTDETQRECNDIIKTVEESNYLKNISNEAASLVSTEEQNENLAKVVKPKGLFKRLSMKKSTTTEDLCDSEDFTSTLSSPQPLSVSVDSSVDNVFKSKKRRIISDDETEVEVTAEDFKEIDVKTIAEIQDRIKTKKAHLEQLQRAEMYKKKHDAEELQEVIATWKTGCNNALNQLHERLQNHGPITMTQLMERLQVPIELLDVDL
ncbi:hypothetical protein FQA39_LY14116 [Lamprigera yunnana]|nr:hypothetical protein FQA39_LY14116 [Lamprigera yunnana]